MHEVLGLMRKDDSRYQISGPVLEELERATSVPSESEAAEDEVDCSATAKRAAELLDQLGWGKVIGYTAKIISTEKPSAQMNLFVHRVRITDRETRASVSGYTYKVKLFQDPKSLSCAILSVTTNDL